MIVLPLCSEHCPEAIPNNLGIKLGDGADGEVFSLLDTNKVIKFSILCEYYNNIRDEFNKIQSTINYIQHDHPCAYAYVYEFNKIAEGNRSTTFGIQNYILYSYVMEKCFPLSSDESKVFYSILSHEDRGIVKNYTASEVKKILSGLARGLDFDEERVIFFYMNLRESPVKHLDLHTRNIMKDAAGNFKLIDFDRVTLEN
jgi:serine/threonine protein kinase